MDNEKMIESIRTLCKDNNISPTKLEEDLKFSQGLISRWKDKTPSIDKIVDIANYFNVSLDEVIGRNKTDDKFLKILTEQTQNNKIKWHNKNTDISNNLKIYNRFNLDFDMSDENDHEITFYTQYNQGYISIYSYYRYNDISNPIDLILFIQPSSDSDYIPQQYCKDEIITLYLKILYNLGNEAPDEIKAEELKNLFIKEYEKPVLKKKNIIIVSKHQNTVSLKKTREASILNKIGCILYDIKSNTVLDKNEIEGVTHIGKDFYYTNKDTLGKVKEAKMKNATDLLLISDTKILKLSGFSCGKQCGSTGYNGLLEILKDAGFDTSDKSIFEQDNFTIYQK